MAIRQVERQSGDGGAVKYKVIEGDGVPAWPAAATLPTIGQRQPRVEGAAKVTGRAVYTADVRRPGQLVARVLRSPYPHARITRIDTTRAAALPGVRAVISAADAPEIAWYQSSRLFDWTVRFVGDEVAAVAADSAAIADDALRLIEVDYAPQPFVTDLEAALAPGAPAVWPDGNRAGDPEVYTRGDPAAGLQAAAVVVEAVYTSHCALHNCFEPHGCVAEWEGDQLTLWDSTQSIFTVREQVAAALALPAHRVRVIKQFMGGGFGSKQIAWKQDVIAALLAQRSGRPVQLMLDRTAENLAVGNRNPTRQQVRLGATAAGRLTAIDVRIEQQIGAYRVGGEAAVVSGPYQTLYRCPNVRTEQVVVFTNTGPAVAFRAPGHVEGAFALEQAMDELADRLTIDPLELRRRNYTDRNQLTDQPYSRADALVQCYERVAAVFGWASYQRPPASGTRRRGIGLAAHDWGGGGDPPGYAWIKLNGDGTADIVTGTQDIGTGTRTGLTQVAAAELGLPLERITLHLGDTATGPYAPVSSGSATQATIGPAIQAAAVDARQQLLVAAAVMLETVPADLTVVDGRIVVQGAPGRALAVAEVMERLAPHMIIGQGACGPKSSDHSVRTFGAQCVEVEVDTATGAVEVVRVVAAHDCGRVINPLLVESQVIGAVTQGVGFALIEERIVDRASGVVLNANLEEYKVPTVADIPAIEYAGVDLPDPVANTTGAKGIGEPPLVPTAPAIANAVFNAVGVRLRHGPLSRAAVLTALSARDDAAEETSDASI